MMFSSHPSLESGDHVHCDFSIHCYRILYKHDFFVIELELNAGGLQA